MRRSARALVWSLALLALLAVFGAYLQPELMLSLATQVWNCF